MILVAAIAINAVVNLRFGRLSDAFPLIGVAIWIAILACAPLRKLAWDRSSAGVAVASVFPQAKSVWEWTRHGWHIPIGYIVGFLAMLLLLLVGWHPDG